VSTIQTPGNGHEKGSQSTCDHEPLNGPETIRTSDLVLIRELSSASNWSKNEPLTDQENRDCISACTHDAKTSGQPLNQADRDDFVTALAMIATLPLSAAEKAEAVRRLLAADNARC
jgi:hypothetical protein